MRQAQCQLVFQIIIQNNSKRITFIFFCFQIHQQISIQQKYYNKQEMKSITVLRIIFTACICIALIGIVLASYILKEKWHIADIGFAYLGVYGIILISFLLLQQIFSLLNNKQWIPKLASNSVNTPKVGLQVVGYRQDPVLFRGCLISLANSEYPALERIIVGIDGNEEKDLLMEQTFRTVFPDGLAIRLDKMYQDLNDNEKKQVENIIGDNRYVCVSQPHCGKRQIMYTAFHLHTKETEFISLTDSDTLFKPNTITEMVKVIDGYDILQKQNPKWRVCGAVTGNVEIWNQQNLVSYLSSLRYWFAFNVERAADSYFGVVSCISGPLGLYRKSIVDKIKDQWLHQTFLGTKCTFGDDRHLTNLILNYGYCTYYTPESVCVTDTPAELLRWIAQQTRWCKSFYREFLINIKSFYKHPPWLAGQLVFQTFFPFFIIATLIWFVNVSIDIYCIIIIMVILMGVVRSIFAIMRTGRFVFLYYSFYVVLYILFLIPSKMWALITVWNNDWGTSARMGRISPVCKAIHALVWAVFFIGYYIGVGIKHVVNQEKFTQIPTIYTFFGCIGFMILLTIHWLYYSNCILLPQCREQFEEKKKQTDEAIAKRRNQTFEFGGTFAYSTVPSQMQIQNPKGLYAKQGNGTLPTIDTNTNFVSDRDLISGSHSLAKIKNAGI